jgi:hypothetical protein
MKKAIQIFAALGFIGCFLPLVVGVPKNVSWWDLRDRESAWIIYSVIGAYGFAFLAATFAKLHKRAGALAALLPLGYIVYEVRVVHYILNTRIGGVMMGIGALGGLAAAAIAYVTRDVTRDD